MKKTLLRLISLLLLASLVAGVVLACGDSGKEPAATTAAADTTAEEKEAPDPLAAYDLGGDTIRIYTSIDATDSTNANALIQGTGEENGEIVNDTVYKRNMDVSELLNVQFEFIPASETYSTVQSAISKIILAGDDVYDLIINDIFPMANLALEGMFRDVSQNPVFDFEAEYWWHEYMKDLSVVGETQYIMTGDFFMDVLCSAHALYFNKQLVENMMGDPDIIYKKVLDGSWTTDEFLTIISDSYQDLNGNTTPDMGDLWGYTCIGMWGSAIPFMLCGDLEFVSRDADGSISGYALNNERAGRTLVMLNDVFYNPATNTEFADIPALVANFTSGLTVFCGYQRIGDFANFRDTEFDVGVAPYPKLDADQERYVTSSHDTTEIGVIPVTSSKFDNTCVAIEALCRETHLQVLPAYYETALKVKYARDDITSQMLDIIHENLRVSFPTAYNGYLGGIFLNDPFSTPLTGKKTDFASTMAKIESKATKNIEKMIETYQTNVG